MTENDVCYLIRPHEDHAVGLFLEQRDNRSRVRRLARGRRVLNVFSYTCGFSVSAALGGAAETVSVDLSRRFLEWGKRNFAENGLTLERHTFFCSDVFDYYKRARRQGRLFDLLVLDPPTFSRARRPKRAFALHKDLDRLVAGAVELLNPRAYLLLSVNHRGTPYARLERAVAHAAGTRPVTAVERPQLPPAFRGDEDYAKSILVQLA